MPAETYENFVFVGSWPLSPASWDVSPKDEYGIGIYAFDQQSGKMQHVETVARDINVGCTYINRSKSVLYCTNECMSLPGGGLGGGGEVCAFEIDRATGRLTLFDRVPSYGSLPTYLCLDDDERYLLVTHHTGRSPITKIVKHGDRFHRVSEYDDATTVVFRLNDNRSIGALCDVHLHTGRGGPLAKQTHSQLHSVVRAPSGSFFLVCDKGNDEIISFHLNDENGKLTIAGGKPLQAMPGSSPRYSVFHPTLPYVFINYETKAVVSTFQYQPDGILTPVCMASSLPDGVEDSLLMMQSDLRMHPSGKYIYNLIRGLNGVSVFCVNEANGQLTRVQNVSLEGVGPRGCGISPDGRFLLVACLRSDDVLILAIDEDGMLTPVRKVAHPFPANVSFLSA